MVTFRPSPVFVVVAVTSVSVGAQDRAAAPEAVQDTQEIVVTAPKPRGAVIGNVPPDIELGEAEVASYGVTSLADLVAALAPQAGSGRGRSDGGPVVLLNGRRVSGFGEIGTIPPEAIQRVQVLPEEAAIAYGYRPEQRVINIILKPDFRSVSTELRVRQSTAGGRGEYQAGGSYFSIGKIGRIGVDLDYQRNTPLLESERGVQATVPDMRPYRTLMPEADILSLNGTLNRTIFDKVSATLNAKVDANDSHGRLGLPLDPDGNVVTMLGALRGDSSTRSMHFGAALNGSIAAWQWSFTGNYDHSRARNRTDIGVDGDALLQRDHSVSTSDTGSAELVLTGSPVALPMGAVQATLKAGGDLIGLESRGSGVFGERSADLSRRQASLGGSLVVPLTSRREDVLAALGDVTANVDAGVKRLSDFGTVNVLGYGLGWQVSDAIRFSVAVSNEEGAPTLGALGNPVSITPNVRIFDYQTGETIDVTRVDGGNPDLRADRRRSWSLSASLRPLRAPDLTIDAGYTHSRTSNPVYSFPAATDAIEAAFPERFVRDESGRLTLVDARSVNFARAMQDELRWGLFLSIPVGTPRADARPPEGAAALRGALPRGPGMGGPRPGGGGPGSRFGGPGGGMPPGQGRFMLSFEHKWRLKDRVLIREGLPELDLLDGDTVSGSGGQPAHQLSGRVNFFKDGFGGSFSGSWQSATRVRGGEAGGASDLFFSDLAKLDARMFVDFNQRPAAIAAHPWLKGLRLSLLVENLFDSRQQVRDAFGAAPAGYQPAYLDPLGRSVRVSLRKLF